VRSGFAVREATQADLDRVTEIKVRNWADTYGALLPPAVLSRYLDRDVQLAELREMAATPNTLILVAEDASGETVGFSLTHFDAEPDPWLESLHVPREFRGTGIGTFLMGATARELRARGYNTMRLAVITGNDAAGRFYQRLGGTMIGVEPAPWAAGVTHEVYRWSDLAALER
jgi:GNAT superfamily N-acetyltransferase